MESGGEHWGLPASLGNRCAPHKTGSPGRWRVAAVPAVPMSRPLRVANGVPWRHISPTMKRPAGLSPWAVEVWIALQRRPPGGSATGGMGSGGIAGGPRCPIGCIRPEHPLRPWALRVGQAGFGPAFSTVVAAASSGDPSSPMPHRVMGRNGMEAAPAWRPAAGPWAVEVQVPPDPQPVEKSLR
jgi:hypothetical protein